MKFFKFLTAQFGLAEADLDYYLMQLFMVPMIHIFAIIPWLFGPTIGQSFPTTPIILVFSGAIVSFSLAAIDNIIELISDYLTRSRSTIRKFFAKNFVPDHLLEYYREPVLPPGYFFPRPMPFVALMSFWASTMGLIGAILHFPWITLGTILVLLLVTIGFIILRKKFDEYYNKIGDKK